MNENADVTVDRIKRWCMEHLPLSEFIRTPDLLYNSNIWVPHSINTALRFFRINLHPGRNSHEANLVVNAEPLP